MQIQKVLDMNKISIIADYREKEIINILKSFGVVVNETNLDIGDFIINSNIVIERKQHSDFISSLIDGRLFEQSKLMKENFKKSIIIIEGYSNRQINENALYSTIASLIIKYEMILINTKNHFDTAKTIYRIGKKSLEENKSLHAFKVVKKPKELKTIQEKVVSSLPGIGNILSKRLLEKFKTLENIFTASESELKKVKGISDKTAKKIKKILTANYE